MQKVYIPRGADAPGTGSQHAATAPWTRVCTEPPSLVGLPEEGDGTGGDPPCRAGWPPTIPAAASSHAQRTRRLTLNLIYPLLFPSMGQRSPMHSRGDSGFPAPPRSQGSQPGIPQLMRWPGRTRSMSTCVGWGKGIQGDKLGAGALEVTAPRSPERWRCHPTLPAPAPQGTWVPPNPSPWGQGRVTSRNGALCPTPALSASLH